jgi:hypothetical protein
MLTYVGISILSLGNLPEVIEARKTGSRWYLEDLSKVAKTVS